MSLSRYPANLKITRGNCHLWDKKAVKNKNWDSVIISLVTAKMVWFIMTKFQAVSLTCL